MILNKELQRNSPAVTLASSALLACRKEVNACAVEPTMCACTVRFVTFQVRRNACSSFSLCVAADHSFGDNETVMGGGVSFNDSMGYAAALDAFTVVQNSWNYEFFNGATGNDVVFLSQVLYILLL